MAGKAKKKPAGKGKAAPTKAKKPKAKVAAKSAAKGKPKGKLAAKGKATPKKVMKAKPASKAAKPKAVAKPRAAAKPKAAAKPTKPTSGGGALLQGEILAMARQVYGDLPDARLLALDPNDVDEMDPATFYEMIGEKFGVTGDPTKQNFAGFGGTIKQLIEFVGSRWDGKTRGDAPMPPQEWLDEVVHPATERVPEQAEPLDEPLLD